jgi:large subunit ribosomal protein L14
MATKKKTAGGTQIERITKGLPIGAQLVAADNSGARILNLVAVKGAKMRVRQVPSAQVGDLCICSVVKGNQKIRRQIVHAIIIRQRQRYKRSDGTSVSFFDNAAVIVNENGDLKATEIRGSVAKECAEKWPRLSSAATMII